jgi:hypothetical protein
VTTIIQGTQLRLIRYGTKVDKTAAVLPAGAAGTIFTVSGGRVIVTGIVGECTTVCDGTATTLKITSTPTTGTAVDLTSTTAITSKEVGALVSLPLTLGGALVVNNAGAAEVPGALQFVVPIGTIQITTSATNTGAFKWSLTYVPLDDGASVA